MDSHPELAAILDAVPPFLQDDAEDLLNTVLQRLGIHDFYTANLMTVSRSPMASDSDERLKRVSNSLLFQKEGKS